MPILYQPVLQTLFSRVKSCKYFLSPHVYKLLLNDYYYKRENGGYQENILTTYADLSFYMMPGYKQIMSNLRGYYFSDLDILTQEEHDKIYKTYGHIFSMKYNQDYGYYYYYITMDKKVKLSKRKFLKQLSKKAKRVLNQVSDVLGIDSRTLFNELLYNEQKFISYILLFKDSKLSIYQKLYTVGLILSYVFQYWFNIEDKDLSYQQELPEIYNRYHIENYVPKYTQNYFLYDCLPLEYCKSKAFEFQEQTLFNEVIKVVQTMNQEDYGYNSVGYVKKNIIQ